MSNKIYFKPQSRYLYFTDIQKENAFYCLDPEVKKELNNILAKYGHDNRKAPPEIMVKAYRLNKTDEDQRYDYYDIMEPEPVDFPVYRIEWIGVWSTT